MEDNLVFLSWEYCFPSKIGFFSRLNFYIEFFKKRSIKICYHKNWTYHTLSSKESKPLNLLVHTTYELSFMMTIYRLEKEKESRRRYYKKMPYQ